MTPPSRNKITMAHAVSGFQACADGDRMWMDRYMYRIGIDINKVGARSRSPQLLTSDVPINAHYSNLNTNASIAYQ